MATAAPVPELYPAIEPFNHGFLDVDDVHSLYYEESGNPEGKPVVVVHGGPGGGVDGWYRQFFNPQVYRIVMFDQRGAGKSTPLACLENNTTWHLVADMEKIRQHLNIDTWTVFGGSWGSTLSLTYAIKHTDRVQALILRGIFLCRRKELLWFYQEGASYLFPEEFALYRDHIPVEEQSDLIAAYHKRLTSEDEETQLEAAKRWARWEMATSRLIVDPANIARAEENREFALSFARIENHYFENRVFFESDNWILENIDTIRHIPTFIVQGRYDVVCPALSAYDLKQAAPEFELVIIADAGHSMKEDGILAALVGAADKFAGVENPALTKKKTTGIFCC